MSRMHRSLAIISGMALAFGLAVASTSEAREFKRSGTFVTGKGGSGQLESSGSGRLRDGRFRQQTITSPAGRSASRSTTSRYDRDSGTFSRSSSGFRDGSRSIAGTAENGRFSGVYSGASGRSGSFSGTATRLDDGTRVRSGGFTTASGNTGSFATERGRDEEGSRYRNRTVTTASGDIYQRSVSNQYDKDSKTLTQTVTGPSGETRQRSVVFQPER